jgi:hypothetical protein
MTFLNPSILFALTAIAIPIIIHFFNLRKLKKVEFSTLMFLKELQKSKMKRIKLKQLLLLLFRILVIVFLVLTFANPVYKGIAGDNSGSSASVIIIDNSFSMAGKDAYGEYLEQAKTSANDIISTLNPYDEVIIIPSSEFGKDTPKYWTNTQTNFRDSIKNISISYKDFNVNEGLEISKNILAKSYSLNKNIFLISDFQKNNLNSGRQINTFGETSFYAINIGQREINNISLEDLKIESAIIEKGRDVKLSVNLHNYSKYNVTNKKVNVYAKSNDSNYVLKSEKVFDLQSSENKKIELTFKAEKSGSNSGMIELVLDNAQDDEIKYDNKIYFSFYIPEKFNIAVIGNDTRFIKLAIESASSLLNEPSKDKSENLMISEFSSIPANITNFNILFLAGLEKLSSSEIEGLSNFVNNGGTIYILPSQNIDLVSYNNLTGKMNAAKINYLNTDTDINKSLKFSRVNFEHPLLSGIFKNDKLNFTSEKFLLDSPEIKSYFVLTPGEKDITLIELSNNKPFLIENNYGQGRVILNAVSANDKMSDFPMKTIFVPLIIRSVFYSAGNVSNTDYTIGKNNVVYISGLSKIKNITNPAGQTFSYDLLQNSFYIALPYSSFLSMPGVYTFSDSTKTGKTEFALNFNYAESNLAKEENKEIENYFKQSFKNVKLVNDITGIKQSIKETKSGLELWKYFLILALLFIAAEIILSKKLIQE